MTNRKSQALVTKVFQCSRHELCAVLFLGWLLTMFTPVFAQEGLIEAGDYLFIQAIVKDCGSHHHTVQAGKVEPTGLIILFTDISLKLDGTTPGEASLAITDAIEEKAGYRPSSIRVLRVSSDDDESMERETRSYARWVESNCQPHQNKMILDEWKYHWQLAHSLLIAVPGEPVRTS